MFFCYVLKIVWNMLSLAKIPLVCISNKFFAEAVGFLCCFEVIENINNYWASCGLEIDLVVGFLFGSYLSALKWIIGV